MYGTGKIFIKFFGDILYKEEGLSKKLLFILANRESWHTYF